ncbi:MAG: MAPEG family protein [Chromatiales bacterium]|nr:MAPEG family protein [Chromatiales bacterium]
MQNSAIFFPVAGMAFLTLVVGVRLLQLRMRAVYKDGLNPGYFSYNRGAKLPDYLIKATQHYDNLFEMPLLFYLVALFVVLFEQVDLVYTLLAWCYLLLRAVHAVVHLGRNDLRQRRRLFLASSLVLYIMWGRLLLQLVLA